MDKHPSKKDIHTTLSTSQRGAKYNWKTMHQRCLKSTSVTHTRGHRGKNPRTIRYGLTRNICSVTDDSNYFKWAAPSEFGTYRLCKQRRFGRACASAQSRQNLRCSLIQAVSQEEPSDGKPDPWPLWMAGHAQLKFVMTECSKTQIRLTRPNWFGWSVCVT